MTENKNKLNEPLQHIQRMGKILYRLSSIAKVVIAVMIVAQATLTVAVLFDPKVAMYIGEHLDSTFLFRFLKFASGLKSMELKYQAVIGCFVTLIMYIVFFMLAKTTGQLMYYLANEASSPLP